MMKLRKCTSFLLAVVMLVSLCVTAGAQEPAAGEMDGCVVVMHTNDVHGAIDGYAKVAALKESYEAREPMCCCWMRGILPREILLSASRRVPLRWS